VAMIVGGIVGSIMFPGFVVVGVSVTVAGVIGLATLLPQVRAWIDEQAASPARTPAPAPALDET